MNEETNGPRPEDIGFTPKPEEAREKDPTIDSQEKKLEIYGNIDDDFVLTLRNLKDELLIPDGAKVIYPGSSTHVGVARVFGYENVVHVEPDMNACKILTKNGYIAEQVNIEDFHPAEQLDGIIALNSYGVPTEEMIDELIKQDGFIIANNYTHWAHMLSEITGIQLVAAILPSYDVSANPHIYRDEEIPQGATRLVTTYDKLIDGKLVEGTPDDHTGTDEESVYPDGLFAFKLLN